MSTWQQYWKNVVLATNFALTIHWILDTLCELITD